ALLTSHPLRSPDEVPAGLSVRRTADGGPSFSSPRLVVGGKVDIPGKRRGSTPQGVRLQGPVDGPGRAQEPVVLQSTSPVLSYVVLESLKDWQFDPARSGEAPVAAFYEIQFPTHRPLSEVVAFRGSPLAETEALLHAGSFADADKKV